MLSEMIKAKDLPRSH